MCVFCSTLSLLYLLNIFLKFLVTLWLLLSLEKDCERGTEGSDAGGGGGGGEEGGQEMMTIGDTDISTWCWLCLLAVSSPLCQDTRLPLLVFFPSLGRLSSKLWVLQILTVKSGNRQTGRASIALLSVRIS